MTHKSIYFYGNKISEYGLQNNRVDYATLAKAFDAVLNNDIMQELERAGFYFEQESGFIDNSEAIEELQEQIEELEALDEISEETQEQIDSLQEQIEELENEESPSEIYQYYIVSDNGASILKEYNEIVFYCEAVDMYIWGVTHYGTSWSYVLTDIVLELEEVQK